ncbi:hypothetical protein [Sulfobacillus harzensis]|uniref:Uncharacterized protein n=1 Tax=Sulfobacillus harzensis TaxID=2729629 RepID=A0A7Y0Q4B8_9FIRM|nr:hypothetical protein [Sulfobacillus harzensis]NMP24260.1 hypothetical protein [Sulfobacillus harzensis]
MSTHIEHGTRVRVKTVMELNALMLEFRRQVGTIARNAYQQTAAELTYQILDEAVLQPTHEAFLNAVRAEYATGPIESPQPFTDTDLRWIVRHIIADHQATIARTQERDPAYDWGCRLSAIPHRTGLYVLLYAESDRFRPRFRDTRDLFRRVTPQLGILHPHRRPMVEPSGYPGCHLHGRPKV